MPYTLWSRGRLLGESDLGFVQVYENVKFGWFHPSPAGERLMSVLTGTGPALMKLNRMMRNPMRALMRGKGQEDPGEFPRDIRATTAYADLVSIVDELESLQLELRDPDGKAVDVEHMGIDDTVWKASLVPKRLRKKMDLDREPLSPLERYQLQVHLSGVPPRRLHVPGLDD